MVGLPKYILLVWEYVLAIESAVSSKACLEDAVKTHLQVYGVY